MGKLLVLLYKHGWIGLLNSIPHSLSNVVLGYLHTRVALRLRPRYRLRIWAIFIHLGLFTLWVTASFTAVTFSIGSTHARLTTAGPIVGARLGQYLTPLVIWVLSGKVQFGYQGMASLRGCLRSTCLTSIVGCVLQELAYATIILIG